MSLGQSLLRMGLTFACFQSVVSLLVRGDTLNNMQGVLRIDAGSIRSLELNISSPLALEVLSFYNIFNFKSSKIVCPRPFVWV